VTPAQFGTSATFEADPTFPGTTPSTEDTSYGYPAATGVAPINSVVVSATP
jgi:hypothetical protein